MKFNLKILFILTLVLVFALYGCVNSNTNEQDTADNTYEPMSEKEATPVNEDAKNFDDFIKPLLEQVFGQAKLILSSSTASSNVHNYALGEALTETNYDKLITLLNEAGYEVLLKQNFGDGITSQLSNDNDQSRLLVQGTFGDKELIVSLTQIS